MDAQAIIKAVLAAAQTAEALAALIDGAKDVFTSDNAGEVAAAQQRLAAANDQLHERVQDKLAKAAQAG